MAERIVFCHTCPIVIPCPYHNVRASLYLKEMEGAILTPEQQVRELKEMESMEKTAKLCPLLNLGETLRSLISSVETAMDTIKDLDFKLEEHAGLLRQQIQEQREMIKQLEAGPHG